MFEQEILEELNMKIADAVHDNWVDSFAPKWMNPYLKLSRFDRPIGTWLLLIPCWWGLLLGIIDDQNLKLHDVWIFFGCAIGATLMRGSGCTWNDIADRKFDGMVERTRNRPIPLGQVTVRKAIFWIVFQTILASFVLFSFNKLTIFLGFISLLPVAIYPFAKRFTWWPQFFLGIAFNWGALLAFAAHTGTLNIAAICLYLSGIAWTLFYDTIYALQDIEDDALIGIKSTARLFGKDSKRWLFVFVLLGCLWMGISLFLVTEGISLFLCLLGVLGFAFHSFWQISKIVPEDGTILLRLFRSNRNAGLIPVLFFLLAVFIG